MKDILNCGIVGFGYMGQIRKAVVERHEHLNLSGICDTNQAIRDKIKGCPIFNSFDDLLKEDIDIIFVCTPNSFSPDVCIKSMKKGLHVFCEKPPGRNIQDIIDIKKNKSTNTKLMFGFNHRFHPGVMKAKGRGSISPAISTARFLTALNPPFKPL
jgi:predicted dehydrogenase